MDALRSTRLYPSMLDSACGTVSIHPNGAGSKLWGAGAGGNSRRRAFSFCFLKPSRCRVVCKGAVCSDPQGCWNARRAFSYPRLSLRCRGLVPRSDRSPWARRRNFASWPSNAVEENLAGNGWMKKKKSRGGGRQRCVGKRANSELEPDDDSLQNSNSRFTGFEAQQNERAPISSFEIEKTAEERVKHEEMAECHKHTESPKITVQNPKFKNQEIDAVSSIIPLSFIRKKLWILRTFPSLRASKTECESSSERHKISIRNLNQTVSKILNKIVTKLSDQKSIRNLDLMNANWPFVAETNFFEFLWLLGKYTFVVTGTGVILAAGFYLAGGTRELMAILWESWAAGITIGSVVGAKQVLFRLSAAVRRNVLVTGSTRGLGKALAREFILAGDNVVITSRSIKSVQQTILELQNECQVPVSIIYQQNKSNGYHRVENIIEVHESFSSFKKRKQGMKQQTILGIACNVQEANSVKTLAELSINEFHQIDLWINNAGFNSEAKSFLECTDDEINNVVKTNLIGSLLCTQQAILLMKEQTNGGHVFNMDGAGYSGGSTPRYAVYGATKCALRQMQTTLLDECKIHERVGIHTISPGMVLTDLLLSGATVQNKQMFNIICEQPETVARALVPKIRSVNGTGKAVDYLTPPRIAFAIITAWLRRGRWFDEEGRIVYAAETDRLRAWAEGRRKDPILVAIEMLPSGAWISLLSSSFLCACIILVSTYGRDIIPPG